MTESNAYLAYGIMVTTESLLYAVAAWPKLQGPFTFLDIVQLRCKNGTLRAEEPGTGTPSIFQTLPIEVWGNVRHMLVDLELREAEIIHLSDLWCDGCRAERLARGQTWHSRPVYCSTCMDAWSTFTGLGNSQLAEMTRSFLSHFELALPTTTPVCGSNEVDSIEPFSPFANPKTATMVSLPPPACGGNDAFALHANIGIGGWSGVDEQAIVDVSFDIPPDTTPRFRRLVSRLHLQPVEITDGLFAIAGTEPTERRRSRGCFRHYEEVCLYSMRPGWKFIAMAQTTW